MKITSRVVKMRRDHHTASIMPIARWRMSQATIEAMIAEQGVTYPAEPGTPPTLFGKPLTVDDSMAFGAVDLVPDTTRGNYME